MVLAWFFEGLFGTNFDHLAGDNSTVDLRYTEQYSKMSCYVEWYYIHVAFCFLVYYSGIACMFTRLVPALHWTHAWFGRVYVLGMLLATASSMLVHNDGLPRAVLFSFVWVLGGLAVGWFVIKFHELKMERVAMEKVEGKLRAGEQVGPLMQAVNRAKGEIARGKSWTERFFSLKATHGVVMFLSWFNIAGRIAFVTVHHDFTCWTYPAYKPVNAMQYQTAGKILEGKSVEELMLPLVDPNYERLPWAQTGLVAWNLIGLVMPVIIASVLGMTISKVSALVENRWAGKEVSYVPEGASKKDSAEPLVDTALGS